MTTFPFVVEVPFQVDRSVEPTGISKAIVRGRTRCSLALWTAILPHHPVAHDESSSTWAITAAPIPGIVGEPLGIAVVVPDGLGVAVPDEDGLGVGVPEAPSVTSLQEKNASLLSLRCQIVYITCCPVRAG